MAGFGEELGRLWKATKITLSWILVFTSATIGAVIGLEKAAPGDLDCFLAAGRAVLRGDNPYASPSLLYENVFGDYHGPAISMSPPITLLAYAPLSRYDTFSLLPIWQIASVLFYLLALSLLAHHYKPRTLKVAWAFALAGLWISIAVGQIYTLLLLLVVCAWLALDKHRAIIGGCLIGLLVAVKPNFAVWPVLLLLRGSRKASLAAIIVAVSCSAIPLALWGPSIYQQWLVYSSSAGEMFFPTNMSFVGIALRLGIPFWGYIASAVLLLGVAIWTALVKPNADALCAVSLISSLFAGPAGWMGYTVLLLPIFFYQKLNRRLVASAILLLFPATLLWSLGEVSKLNLNLVGLIYPMALGLILWSTFSGHSVVVNLQRLILGIVNRIGMAKSY